MVRSGRTSRSFSKGRPIIVFRAIFALEACSIWVGCRRLFPARLMVRVGELIETVVRSWGAFDACQASIGSELGKKILDGAWCDAEFGG